MDKISELLNLLKTVFAILWAIPFLRYVVILGAGYTVFMIVLCIALERRPSKGLYRAKKKSSVERMSLGELKARVHDDPDSWLLYEDEIFHVDNPEALRGEKREAYEAALARIQNGGNAARMIGRRVYIERRDAKAYRRFLYSFYQGRRRPADRAAAKAAPAG